jgi:deoxyribose-phosphate aldolase
MSTSAKNLVDPRDWKAVAGVIDHTILKPEATPKQIEQLCREAAHYGFAAVCVQPGYVALAAALLRTTPVKVASVVGFPQGATLSSVKRFEAFQAVRLGADEIDMVQNVGALKAGDRDRVRTDIGAVVAVAHANGAIVKVILENALLTREEKVLACELALAAGADFVKTSTGFSSGGATVDDVALMRATVGSRAGVKAAGGIRTAADIAAMLKAGADRIGASASVAIVKELGAPDIG